MRCDITQSGVSAIFAAIFSVVVHHCMMNSYELGGPPQFHHPCPHHTLAPFSFYPGATFSHRHVMHTQYRLSTAHHHTCNSLQTWKEAHFTSPYFLASPCGTTGSSRFGSWNRPGQWPALWFRSGRPKKIPSWADWTCMLKRLRKRSLLELSIHHSDRVCVAQDVSITHEAAVCLSIISPTFYLLLLYKSCSISHTIQEATGRPCERFRQTY